MGSRVSLAGELWEYINKRGLIDNLSRRTMLLIGTGVSTLVVVLVVFLFFTGPMPGSHLYVIYPDKGKYTLSINGASPGVWRTSKANFELIEFGDERIKYHIVAKLEDGRIFDQTVDHGTYVLNLSDTWTVSSEQIVYVKNDRRSERDFSKPKISTAQSWLEPLKDRGFGLHQVTDRLSPLVFDFDTEPPSAIDATEARKQGLIGPDKVVVKLSLARR